MKKKGSSGPFFTLRFLVRPKFLHPQGRCPSPFSFGKCLPALIKYRARGGGVAFYADLSEVYDDLFPVSVAQRELFDWIRGTGGIRRVADAGCGSGAQLLHFASAGLSCVGFDPDPALVALAREKLALFPVARGDVGGVAETAPLGPPARDPF